MVSAFERLYPLAGAARIPAIVRRAAVPTRPAQASLVADDYRFPHMSIIVVATVDELRLLTKQERLVYEMYRHEGKTREAICTELKIGKDGFRRHWWSAIKKIIAHRKLTENPQHFLAQGRDILRGDVQLGQVKPFDTGSISNVSKLGREPVAPDTSGDHVQQPPQEPELTDDE